MLSINAIPFKNDYRMSVHSSVGVMNETERHRLQSYLTALDSTMAALRTIAIRRPHPVEGDKLLEQLKQLEQRAERLRKKCLKD